MSRLRHFAAGLLAVLLLQVSLLGAGVTCAPWLTSAAAGGTTHAPALDASHHGGHGHHGHGGGDRSHTAPAAADEHASDDAPAPSHHGGQLHCATAASCAPAALAGAVTVAAGDGVAAAGRIAVPDARAPASVIGAPEPPPPRA